MSIFPKKIEKKFTAHLKNVLKESEQTAYECFHTEVAIEHLIFGILTQEGSIGSNILGREKMDLQELKARIHKLPQDPVRGKLKFADNLKSIFQDMTLCASRYNHSYIGTEHLLCAILESNDPKAQ